MTRSVEFRALGLAIERKNFEPWRPWEGSAKLAENEKFVEPNNQRNVNEPLRHELPAEKRSYRIECITDVAAQLVENSNFKDPETKTNIHGPIPQESNK